MALQYPPFQIYETTDPGSLPKFIELPLNPILPRIFLYVYAFLGVEGPGAGHIALDYRFYSGETSLFSLPFVYNATTTAANRWPGSSPAPADPLWPSGFASLFSWGNAPSASSDDLLMFTPLNLIANEPNKTPLIPFEIVLPASKVRIQFISYSGPAATLARFWTGIMQADINL